MNVQCILLEEYTYTTGRLDLRQLPVDLYIDETV